MIMKEKTGGTAYTVRYTQKEGLKIVNITDLSIKSPEQTFEKYNNIFTFFCQGE